MKVRGQSIGRVGIAGAGVMLCAVAACTPVGAGSNVGGGTSAPPAPVVSSAPVASPSPVATPSPASTAPTISVPAYPGGYLQIGSSGAAVTAIQQKLSVEPVTGYFGTITQAAVLTFQRSNGLEVDGQVGPQTWAKIFNVAVPTAPAPAAKPSGPAYPAIVRQPGLGTEALALIQKYAGKPYLYGAAGPNAFDCSGLTMYVYNQLGVQLMRSANDQYRTTLHVPYSQAQPGDLIFFYDTSGYVYHVGMYAGNGMMWDAPHSGAVVRYENVWYPDQVWVGVPGARVAS
jgi:cell wall-associated NlpC family hydrolase